MLPAPQLSQLLAHWSAQPLAIAAAAGSLGWYLTAVRSQQRRARGSSWPMRRTVTFVGGVALFVWTTCGWPEAYRGALYWVWTAQTLALLLVLPILILAGKPLDLAGSHSAVRRALRSRPARFMANPLVGPALVPVLSVVLFFGPVPEWAVRWDAFAWALQLLMVVIGALIVLPLVTTDVESSSLAVGLALAIGSLELVLDAIPGIALRLHTKPVTDYFAYRAVHGWTPSRIHDQQVGGAILWCVAELIDVPFLLLTFRRWVAVDARDAAEADAVLEAERTARAAHEVEEPERDAPWWLTDPQMRERGLGRRDD